MSDSTNEQYATDDMNFYISQYWTIILILVGCQHVVNVSGINMFMKSSVSWSVLARYTLLGFRQNYAWLFSNFGHQ